MSIPTSGYSGKTLATKLGIGAGMSVAVIAPPPHYRELIADAPLDAKITSLAVDADWSGLKFLRRRAPKA